MPLLAPPTVLRWIHSRLSADSALTALIGGGAPRIVDEQAPEGIAFPYVLVSVIVPGRPEYRVGARGVVVEGIYLVRGVARAESYTSTLETIATRIILQLHGQQDNAAGINSSILDEVFTLAETGNDQTYRHMGGRFRIAALAT